MLAKQPSDASTILHPDCVVHVCVLCRENLPASDKAIAQILMEVPMLPSASVGQVLCEVAGLGGQWATLALSSARDIIINRPPNRCASRLNGLLQAV